MFHCERAVDIDRARTGKRGHAANRCKPPLAVAVPASGVDGAPAVDVQRSISVQAHGHPAVSAVGAVVPRCAGSGNGDRGRGWCA